MVFRNLAAASALAVFMGFTGSATAGPEQRQALFGETHLHTNRSFDAFIFGNRNGPDEAYEFAKGKAIKHPAGFDMKMRVPLDFQAVTDHAMYLGMVPAMFDTSTEVSKHPVATRLRTAKTAGERRAAFGAMLPYLGQQVEDDLLDMDIVRSTWDEVMEAAERHNEPGKFTTFIGYEYTSSQNNFENLHRNVIFKGDAPDEPFSRLVSKTRKTYGAGWTVYARKAWTRLPFRIIPTAQTALCSPTRPMMAARLRWPIARCACAMSRWSRSAR